MIAQAINHSDPSLGLRTVLLLVPSSWLRTISERTSHRTKLIDSIDPLQIDPLLEENGAIPVEYEAVAHRP